MARLPRRSRGFIAAALLLGCVVPVGGCANSSLPANGTMLEVHEDPAVAAKRQEAYAKLYDSKGRNVSQVAAKAAADAAKRKSSQSGMSQPH